MQVAYSVLDSRAFCSLFLEVIVSDILLRSVRCGAYGSYTRKLYCSVSGRLLLKRVLIPCKAKHTVAVGQYSSAA